MCESERACQALQCGVKGQLLLMTNINIISLCVCMSLCVSVCGCAVGCPGFCSHVKDSKALTVCCCTNSTLETVSKCCHLSETHCVSVLLRSAVSDW